MLGPKTLNSNREQADYFRLDADYVINVAEAISLNIHDFKEKSDSIEKKIRKGEELNPFEGHLFGSIFIGDAEFLHPSASWVQSRLIKILLTMSDGPVHHKWERIAKEHYNIGKLSEPGFSLPSDFQVKGEKPTNYVSGLSDSTKLGVSILDLEWFIYICDENGVDYDPDFVQRTKKESLHYFTGKEDELSHDVRKFQMELFTNASEWLENVMERFNMRSFLGWKMNRIVNKTVENDLSA